MATSCLTLCPQAGCCDTCARSCNTSCRVICGGGSTGSAAAEHQVYAHRPVRQPCHVACRGTLKLQAVLPATNSAASRHHSWVDSRRAQALPWMSEICWTTCASLRRFARSNKSTNPQPALTWMSEICWLMSSAVGEVASSPSSWTTTNPSRGCSACSSSVAGGKESMQGLRRGTLYHNKPLPRLLRLQQPVW